MLRMVTKVTPTSMLENIFIWHLIFVPFLQFGSIFSSNSVLVRKLILVLVLVLMHDKAITFVPFMKITLAMSDLGLHLCSVHSAFLYLTYVMCLPLAWLRSLKGL